MAFLFAGHDTTSTLMSWFIHMLTQNPGNYGFFIVVSDLLIIIIIIVSVISISIIVVIIIC